MFESKTLKQSYIFMFEDYYIIIIIIKRLNFYYFMHISFRTYMHFPLNFLKYYVGHMIINKKTQMINHIIVSIK